MQAASGKSSRRIARDHPKVLAPGHRRAIAFGSSECSESLRAQLAGSAPSPACGGGLGRGRGGGAAAVPAVSPIARAQTYPARPITIIVGAAAGGPTDTIGRIITDRMRNALGQSIVIENNGAAAGSIAHGRAARAAPDGYTLSLGHWGTHVVNGAVYSLQYHVLNDFEPVALISRSPYFIVGRRELPVEDLKGLVSFLKANGEKVTQGTSGAGSPGHIGGVLLQSILGTRSVFVPYCGANRLMQALL